MYDIFRVKGCRLFKCSGDNYGSCLGLSQDGFAVQTGPGQMTQAIKISSAVLCCAMQPSVAQSRQMIEA